MKNFFSLISNNGKARLGEISTFHGKIMTPTFMPVGTLGTVKGIFQEHLKKLDIKIILGNTYHLMLRPGEKLIQKMGGLQKFIGWNGPILTDSGGFQIWSLSKLRSLDKDGVTFSSHIDGKSYRLTPEYSIEIQEKLNSNICMVLDECPNHNLGYNECSESLNLTLKWAKRCKYQFKKRPGFGIFGINQGGLYKDLRKKSAQELIKLDFDGYALGGLSVGEKNTEMVKIINYTTKYLPEDKPRYLMGVGRPLDIFRAVESGIDMFDCVLPTRFGRNGRAFTTQGEINLRNAKFVDDNSPLDAKIDCFVSNNYSKSYIHHLTKSNEILSSMILSLHNIAFYEKMMSDIRNSIKLNKFTQLMKSYFEQDTFYEKN